MGQECKAYLYDMSMFTFHRPILLVSMWARNSMMDAMRGK
jgi:hypothetical protein